MMESPKSVGCGGINLDAPFRRDLRRRARGDRNDHLGDVAMKVKLAVRGGGQARYEMEDGQVFHVTPEGWVLGADCRSVAHPLVDDIVDAIVEFNKFKPLPDFRA